MHRQTKRDFGTLKTDEIIYPQLSSIAKAEDLVTKAPLLARLILDTFDDYYIRSRDIPWLAKQAFEERDWLKAIELSQERIAIFSLAVSKTVGNLRPFIFDNDRLNGLWPQVDCTFKELLKDRYEADLALAFLNAVHRSLNDMHFLTVDYAKLSPVGDANDIIIEIPIADEEVMTPVLVEKILAIPQINAPFANLPQAASLSAERINSELHISPQRPLEKIEVIDAGFYRNRGAYIAGAVRIAGETHPLSLALLHGETGIEVDAVILREATLRHVFSSTLANFHVTTRAYHELVDYLYRLMPVRPRAMHYSTVGYNHVGKMAVAQQITGSLERYRQQLDYAPGARGSVALAFTSGDTQYVLKVIRDQPTDQYKWGAFAGKSAVLSKYHSVHEQNRSGSMLDNIVYSNLLLPRQLFNPDLLDDLITHAASSVSLDGEHVMFGHLIVQRKLTPVPLYLETCNRTEAEMVVIRLGQCIRNNAATNVFNKDLDGRNYGVSSLRFVYLFDYDAVEPLTDVKIHTNAGREAGEEDIPDWFFEEGEVFLPEELEAHLRLPDRHLRRLFRQAHGELLGIDYWHRMQAWLQAGRVPRVRTYPRGCQLALAQAQDNLVLSPIDAE